jgi:exosortase F-associated protein
MSSSWTWQKIPLIVLALVGLATVYLFQRVDYARMITQTLSWPSANPEVAFVINKTLRMVANDLLCLVIIRAWFADEGATRLAWWVFGFELLLILPLYLVIKLWLEGPTELSVPWLQQVHRLVVNPMLMILLMASLKLRYFK